jgi:hypothetical protein
MRVRALLFISSFLSIWLSISSTVYACSICGCDPAAGTLGLYRPITNALRLSLEDRVLSKESGSGDAAESERESRAMLRLQYAPLTRLALQAEVAGYLWKRHLGAQGVQDDNGHGLGDVAFSAWYEILRTGGLVPRHVLAVAFGIKLPTGANDRHLPGALPDEHLQLGTGTYDKTFGLAYVYGDLPWALFASANARVNGTNSRNFQYGNALFGSVGVRRNFLESQRLILSLEAQVRSAGKDRIAGGASYDDDSGGKVYYGTASAAFAITDSLLVRGTVQVPVVTKLNGTQTEHPVGYLLFAYDFNL